MFDDESQCAAQVTALPRFARDATITPLPRFEYLIQTTWLTGEIGGKVVYLKELRLKSSRIRGYRGLSGGYRPFGTG